MHMQRKGPGRQQGAALIVSLVLLMVLTVLAVSGMTTSTLELTMAGNTQDAQRAFFASETALDGAVTGSGPFTIDDTVASGDQLGPTLTFEYAPEGTVLATSEASTTFRQIALTAPGGGWEAGTMNAIHFQATSDATTTGRGARSIQQAGYFIMAPAP